MNCVIVHGCPREDRTKDSDYIQDNKKHWLPWLKNELEKKEIRTFTPLMPTPWKPSYLEWKEIFEKLPINEDSILIGHSCGGGFLVRWLGETGKKVRKLILVAPGIMHSGNYLPLKDLLNFGINDSIKENIGEIVIFVSDDDSKGIIKSVDIFSNALGATSIIVKEMGHFTGTREFPELLKMVLE